VTGRPSSLQKPVPPKSSLLEQMQGGTSKSTFSCKMIIKMEEKEAFFSIVTGRETTGAGIRYLTHCMPFWHPMNSIKA